ncbi:LysR family transcriptional regulator [Amycolatopsis oliviviridis]|uniref:LysR family transcriptional regulator n=1 Tax=Amycolatopsis oliviviridis TaxID=1471590 RepID=A0ABQ3LZK0_9PSEU|nr:LysR family transcriptional regulator [Amycolatopsis oliviviridis]GHH28240.1 LysR family transcriptional regulator [Amycolatopsis oliviviridis]
MELRHLRYFLAVFDEGSISQAAKRLDVAQPALSRTMRALEDDLGVPLLTRVSGSATPTEAGRVLADHARAVLERIDTMVEHTRATSVRGEHVRCAAATGDVPLAMQLTSSYPGAEIITGEPGTLLGRLWADNCDVILIRGPFDSQGLDTEVVRTDARVVLLRAGHSLAAKERLHISHLRDEPITIWPAMSDVEREHWAGADLDRHQWREGPTNTTATDVMVAVQRGQAIAFIQGSLLPEGFEPPGICVRPVDGISPSTLRLAWREESTSLAIARFVTHIVAAAGFGRGV